MIILDTNVLSALMQRQPDRKVVSWLDNQPRTSVWTSSITVMEVRFGLQMLAAGRRRSLLTDAFEQVLEMMDSRVVSFDAAAAGESGDLLAMRRRRGRPVDLRDTMIAGIALVQRATLATRNTRHFADLSVSVVNPWTA